MISFCLLLAVTVSGCGKKTVTEKAMEKAFEDSMGGEANIDVDGDTVKIETEDGTLQVGTSELPENWPEDIYIAEGKITSASSHTDGIFNVSIEASESVSDMQTKYKEELEKNGWTINMTFALDDNVLLGAEKDDRSVSITIGIDEGKTLIIIGTSKN